MFGTGLSCTDVALSHVGVRVMLVWAWIGLVWAGIRSGWVAVGVGIGWGWVGLGWDGVGVRVRVGVRLCWSQVRVRIMTFAYIVSSPTGLSYAGFGSAWVAFDVGSGWSRVGLVLGSGLGWG